MWGDYATPYTPLGLDTNSGFQVRVVRRVRVRVRLFYCKAQVLLGGAGTGGRTFMRSIMQQHILTTKEPSRGRMSKRQRSGSYGAVTGSLGLSQPRYTPRMRAPPKARKVYRRAAPRLKVTKALSGFPEQQVVRLKYATMPILGNGTTTIGSHTFNTNSIFDPDYTAGGHQPMGYDQWAAIYQKYRVEKASIFVRFVTQGELKSAVCGIEVVDDPDTTLSIAAIVERATSRKEIVTQESPVTVSRTWTRGGAGGDGVDSYDGAFGSNPTNCDYFTVYAFPTTSGSDALPSNSVTALVDIIYTVKLWDRVLLPLS